MDLKEQELDWLCNHMGHTLHVHRDYYRLPQNTLEVAKVGKLLMAIESGIDKYMGKTLDDVALSDFEDDDTPSMPSTTNQKKGIHVDHKYNTR